MADNWKEGSLHLGGGDRGKAVTLEVSLAQAAGLCQASWGEELSWAWIGVWRGLTEGVQQAQGEGRGGQGQKVSTCPWRPWGLS